MTPLRARLHQLLKGSILQLVDDGVLPADAREVAETGAKMVPPKTPEMGDWSTHVALRLAKLARLPPREVAGKLAAAMVARDAGGPADARVAGGRQVQVAGSQATEQRATPAWADARQGDGAAPRLIARHEVAGPGYINLFLTREAVLGTLLQIASHGGDAFVRAARVPRGRVLVEFISANPTGPLHVAHGRGAVMGDVTANLLAAAGWQVEREYYVNDQGHQIDVMANSVWLRYLVLCGRAVEFPDDFYPGDYITEMAADLHREVGGAWAPSAAFEAAGPPPCPASLAGRCLSAMLARIKHDLARFGVVFDRFLSERELCARHDVAGLCRSLVRSDDGGLVYSKDGGLWFRAQAFGDDKDRCLVRADGRPTYFAGDMAYHHDKMTRGFDRLINIWGADHGGYVARVKGGMAAFGHDPEVLEVLLMQMVSLKQDGAQVRMGKRLGTAVWLADLIDEVGADAVRYTFLRQRPEAQLEFDVSLAKSKSMDNPVFYAQMGHARLAAIGRRATSAGLSARPLTSTLLDALVLDDELALVKSLARAPDVVEDAAQGLQPHLLATYVQALIGQFHSYYTVHKHSARIVGDASAPATHARLALCSALREVVAALLGLLGVSAPDQMQLPSSSGDDEGGQSEGAADRPARAPERGR